MTSHSNQSSIGGPAIQSAMLMSDAVPTQFAPLAAIVAVIAPLAERQLT